MSKPFFILIDQKRNVVKIPYDYEDLREWLAYAARQSAGNHVMEFKTNDELLRYIRKYLKMARQEMMEDEA